MHPATNMASCLLPQNTNSMKPKSLTKNLCQLQTIVGSKVRAAHDCYILQCINSPPINNGAVRHARSLTNGFHYSSPAQSLAINQLQTPEPWQQRCPVRMRRKHTHNSIGHVARDNPEVGQRLSAGEQP